MKTICVYFLLIVGAASVVQAQKVVFSSYIEKTHVSTKAGHLLGFESKSQIELGAFFQQHTPSLNNEGADQIPRRFEEDFAGIYFGSVVHKWTWADIKARVRTGLSNGENFVITPSMHLEAKPAKWARVGLGIGTRSFRPTLQTSFSIIL